MVVWVGGAQLAWPALPWCRGTVSLLEQSESSWAVITEGPAARDGSSGLLHTVSLQPCGPGFVSGSSGLPEQVATTSPLEGW